MRYRVLTAVPTGMKAFGYTRVALVAYNGLLPADKLKINPRFKGLSVIRHGTYSNRGEDSEAQRVIAQWTAEAECLNNGSMVV